MIINVKLKQNMSSNSKQVGMHPLDATGIGLKGAISREARGPRAMHTRSADEGPADLICTVSGAAKGGKREHDGP